MYILSDSPTARETKTQFDTIYMDNYGSGVTLQELSH